MDASCSLDLPSACLTALGQVARHSVARRLSQKGRHAGIAQAKFLECIALSAPLSSCAGRPLGGGSAFIECLRTLNPAFLSQNLPRDRRPDAPTFQHLQICRRDTAFYHTRTLHRSQGSLVDKDYYYLSPRARVAGSAATRPFFQYRGVASRVHSHIYRLLLQ